MVFMKNLFKKILSVSCITSSLFLFSQIYETGVSFDTRVIGSQLGESGASITDGGNNVDDLTLGFTARVDNVVGYLEFDDDGNEDLNFDAAFLAVNDLFDGLVSVRFFDVGYAVGHVDNILPGSGFHGIRLDFQPIDSLGFYISYGLRQTSFLGVYKGDAYTNDSDSLVQNAVNSFANSGSSRSSDDVSAQLHGISAGIEFTSDVIDVGIYGGVMLFENAPYVINPGTSVEAASDVDAFDDNYSASTVALANAGIAIDVLKAFGPEILVLEYGVALGGAFTIDNFRGSTTTEATQNYDMVVLLWGDTPAIGGFSVHYLFVFAPDTATKQQTLGDLNDDYFSEMFEILLEPKFSTGQFDIGVQIIFEIQGTEQSFDQRPGTVGADDGGLDANGDPVNPMHFEIEPYFAWNPAEGFRVAFYYEFRRNDITGLVADRGETSSTEYTEWANSHEIGMRVRSSLNIINDPTLGRTSDIVIPERADLESRRDT